MANVMLEAVVEFASKRPAVLKRITVCIFQPQMVKEFADAVEGRAAKGWMDAAKGVMSSVINFFSGDSSDTRSKHVSNTFSGGDASSGSTRGASARETGQTPSQAAGTSRPHPTHIVVHIYALSRSSIDKLIEELEKLITEYLLDKVLDQPEDQQFISKLTEDQVASIKCLEEVYTVRITIEKGQRINRIRIQGPPNNVTLALDQVHHIFHEVTKEEHHRFIGKQAQWEYFDNDSFEKYPDEINVIIENAYKDNKPFAQWEEQQAQYRLNFNDMVEEMVGDPSSRVRVRRQTKEVDVPSNWDTMGEAEKFKRVELDKASAEYLDVEQKIKATAQNTLNQILKIERVQNPALYKQYVIRKSEMEKANKAEEQNERVLWHGTSTDVLASIDDTGFNRSYCGKNATVYGRGVYFAHDFSYSASPTYSPPDANGVKYVYQSLVLTGEFEKGAPSMIVPPLKSTGGRFDSVVDNVTSPKIFVIFYDTQAYPQYLVTFK